MFSEVFWSGFISTAAALILAIINKLYKSKCKEVEFCCCKIVRDVEGEESLDRNPISTL